MNPLPALHHVFVDFENVGSIDPAVIGEKNVRFTLLLGARQTKLDVGVVEQLLQHAGAVELVRLQSSGRNALDFALAYYVGRAAVTDPGAHFHIIAKDTGYDPLIAHLRSRHIDIQRHSEFPTSGVSTPDKTPPPKPATPPMAGEDPIKRALDHLRKNTSNRPKRLKTLISNLRSRFANQKTDAEITTLVENLEKAGHLSVDDKGRLTYRL